MEECFKERQNYKFLVCGGCLKFEHPCACESFVAGGGDIFPSTGLRLRWSEDSQSS